MRLRRYMMSSALLLMGGLFALMIPAGCGSDGNLTETVGIESGRDLSGIAGPPDTSQLAPVERVSRATYGNANSSAALAYPSINGEEKAVFDGALAFFITDRTAENGLGPIFNQRICLGCHRNSDEAVAGLVTTSTPASRAARSGPTPISTFDTGAPPPTAAFTLFGTFFPASGAFNPLAEFGGPIQHVRTTGSCLPDIVPSEAIDPTLAGGIDPVTGLSALGGRRAMGERAGPPYIGRGLMEAIHAADIVANDDPDDAVKHASGLADPATTNPECPGDCISGRHNENSAAGAFIGGDPVVRVSRFGLRAAGPTLVQFMIGGTQGEIGLTSPFAPFEQNNNQNVGRNCDIAPDPELKAEDILNLRTLIRLISLPDFDACLLVDPATVGPGDPCESIQEGAKLFGIDLNAFRSRMIPGFPGGPIGSTADAERGVAADRQLDCVGCHIPIMRTGQSPAAIGGRHLSNKWVPLFSDLLIHDMGQVPQGKSNPIPPAPFTITAGTFEISRNLADFALPGQGLAFGREWRTPPLMGIGRIGPPFLHDGRVFLSSATVATAPGRTVLTNATVGTNQPLTVTTLENAFLAAIELHDLPATDASANCPIPSGGSTADICPAANSANRSEARNVMVRWRALTSVEQLQVVEFLKAL